VGNLKRRVERLEGGRRGRGFEIIIVHPGETTEEALQKNLAAHPESEKAEVRIILNLSGQDQDPPSAPPPPRPEPKYSAKAPGPAPLKIFR
jgi:hypothetical protein